MTKKKVLSAEQKLQKEKEYVEFLKKRVYSENYKASVSIEEFEKTKKKYDNAKFRLRMMQ
jgi:hypothetical protein